MGWFYINGERVHTSSLNQNPIVSSRWLKSYKRHGVQYIKHEYTHKDGTVMITTTSYTIPVNQTYITAPNGMYLGTMY